MRARHRLAVLLLVVLAAIVLVAPPRAARADGPAAAVVELLDPDPSEQPDTMLITARVTDEEGQPLERQRVEFFVDVDFPGAERLGIGSKTTDATGRATIGYRPTWDGVHVLTARLQRSSAYATAPPW